MAEASAAPSGGNGHVEAQSSADIQPIAPVLPDVGQPRNGANGNGSNGNGHSANDSQANEATTPAPKGAQRVPALPGAVLRSSERSEGRE